MIERYSTMWEELFKEMFNLFEILMSYRYYECSYRKTDIKCKARLKKQNNCYVKTCDHRDHENPNTELSLLKEVILQSASYQSTAMIKKITK